MCVSGPKNAILGLSCIPRIESLICKTTPHFLPPPSLSSHLRTNPQKIFFLRPERFFYQGILIGFCVLLNFHAFLEVIKRRSEFNLLNLSELHSPKRVILSLFLNHTIEIRSVGQQFDTKFLKTSKKITSFVPNLSR